MKTPKREHSPCKASQPQQWQCDMELCSHHEEQEAGTTVSPFLRLRPGGQEAELGQEPCMLEPTTPDLHVHILRGSWSETGVFKQSDTLGGSDLQEVLQAFQGI